MIAIRKARPSDAAILPAIERSAGEAFLAIPDLAWVAGDDVQSAERHDELIAGSFSWVATDANDAPVGFLSAEQHGNALHIWELAVSRHLQGRGTGRALISHAAACARRHGLTEITLTTFRNVAWNEPFYSKLGFRTLTPDALPSRLRTILESEAAAGLPLARRCAMVLRLNSLSDQ